MTNTVTNGISSIEHFVNQFPTERRGWVYVIHATGTNRYKIGRSTEPEARLKQLNQKQSPYPLELVEKFWSIDAITDEQGLHKSLADFQVHGEWFEFENDGGWDWMPRNPVPNRAFLCQFYRPITRQKIEAFVTEWLLVLLDSSLIPYISEISESIEYGLIRVECLQQLLFWARLLDYRLPVHLENCRGLSERETFVAIDSFLSGAWDAMVYFSPLRYTCGNNT